MAETTLTGIVADCSGVEPGAVTRREVAEADLDRHDPATDAIMAFGALVERLRPTGALAAKLRAGDRLTPSDLQDCVRYCTLALMGIRVVNGVVEGEGS